MNSVSSSQTTPTFTTRTYYPWVVITLCALFLLYKYIAQVSPSVMTSELMQTFHVQGAGLGNLAATYFYAYLVVQLFAGPLLDRYSLRKLAAFAILLCALGTLGFAHARTLLEAGLSRGLIGVGAAFATVGYMKAASIWFKPNQFAFVGGLLATAAMAGALFGETPLSLLVQHTSWRTSLHYCSVLGLVIAVLFFLLVRDKNPEVFTREKSVKTMSAAPAFKETLAVLKNKNNWMLTFYSGLAFSPLSVLGGLWGNAFLEAAHHVTSTQAASLTSLMFIGLAIGSPLLGLLSDRLNNRFGVMTLGLLLSLFALLTVLYLPYTNFWLLGSALFLFGFGTGAFMLGFAVAKEANPVFLAATVIALINTGDAIFSGFTEPLTGKLLDMFWTGKIVHGVPYFAVHDYHLALALLPAYLLVALGFLGVAKK